MSYTFNHDKSYAIMGMSGIGKSTLLHMLAGIEQPTDGLIQLGSLNLSTLTFDKKIELLQQNIGLVFQHSCLIEELSIIENVMLKAIIKNETTSQNLKRAHDLLKDMGLEHKAHSSPSTLSGGQQQKIALARAVFYIPQFLLADEPTGNLDQHSGQQIIQILLEYKKKYAMGLIISTHDIKIAQQCDIIVQIQNQCLIDIAQNL